MPRFLNEEHRRKWTASIRRAWKKRKARAALTTQQPDALLAGADLGRKDEFQRSKVGYLQKHAKRLNGSLDQVLRELKIERVQANDAVTRLESAIQSLEAIAEARA